jgi:hypothetical protein
VCEEGISDLERDEIQSLLVKQSIAKDHSMLRVGVLFMKSHWSCTQ